MNSRRLHPMGMHPFGRRVITGLLAGVVATWALVPSQVFACNEEIKTMPQPVDCTENAITRSRCIIEAILEDISETYRFVGGGITSIKQDSTWTFTVSIAQEERIDLITYTVSLTPDGAVTIENRETGVESFDD